MQDKSEALKNLILLSRKEAQRHIDAVIMAEQPSEEFVIKEISEFVRCKFMLEAEDMKKGTSLAELAGLSLSRSMRISPELVAEFDMAKSCDGVSSADAKQTLLLLAIQKKLNIEFDMQSIMKLKTVEDIGKLVYAARFAAP